MENKPLRFRPEEFWINNYQALYENQNYTKFFPKYDSTLYEQLNAITRFSLYFSFLVVISGQNRKFLILPVVLIIMSLVIYYINEFDPQGKSKMLSKVLDIRQEKKDLDEIERIRQYKHDGDIDYNLDIDDEHYDMDFGYDIHSGIIDSNNILRTNGKHERPKFICKNGKCKESLYNVDELNEYKQAICRKPTLNNPFMNPSILDYNTIENTQACNADDKDIQDQITVNFNQDLYRDVDDVWERKNSQRQFYTVPNTAIPNLQNDFAKWLYHVPETCKENQYSCLRYIDTIKNRSVLIS